MLQDEQGWENTKEDHPLAGDSGSPTFTQQGACCQAQATAFLLWALLCLHPSSAAEVRGGGVKSPGLLGQEMPEVAEGRAGWLSELPESVLSN